MRVRIAPSPTGDPHVGTAYIALFNYVLAKKHGGQFVLRIEDTDRTRSQPAWEQMIIDALRWLGVTWDEGPDVGGPHGPYRQSERGAIYADHAQMLMDRGAAYRCFCDAARLDALRQQQRELKQNPGYDGHCRTLSKSEVQARLRDGVANVVRLAVDKAASTKVIDRLRGEVVFENQQVDDQVLLKSDGMPTYHLANVVDDHLMEITHVMRAEEWITSTPKHVMLYRGFGWQEPEWIHMPLLRNADKSKISKRKNPVSINYYREAGIFPEVLLNYLGMMGWTMPDGREKFTLQAMIDSFSLERMHLGGPVFDVQKLIWLNGVYLRELQPKALVQRIRDTVLTDKALEDIAPLVQPRVDKLEDFVSYAAFFFTGDVTYDAAATRDLIPKSRTVKDVVTWLQQLIERIDGMSTFDVPVVEATLRSLCESLAIKPKDLFMPVRVAVTGRSATPSLFETLAILGKEKCRRRLRGCVEHLQKQPELT